MINLDSSNKILASSIQSMKSLSRTEIAEATQKINNIRQSFIDPVALPISLKSPELTHNKLYNELSHKLVGILKWDQLYYIRNDKTQAKIVKSMKKLDKDYHIVSDLIKKARLAKEANQPLRRSR